MRSSRRALTGLIAVLAAASLTAAACSSSGSGSGGSSSDLSGSIRIDGSSTVAPLSEAAAELFMEQNPGVQVSVATSGTGGGFEKFCNGETDISDASRKIKQSEIDLCAQNGIKYEELSVALDGLTVVVNNENTWAQCLTVEQLALIWAPGSTVNNWNQVDPSFPNERLTLYGAGTDSGTFDYFTDAINGEEGASRTDYNATEDDNVTVQGVSGSKGALGYFGFSYLEENAGKVKAVAIDDGSGCVTPSLETVQSGEYTPLSRSLYIYPSDKALARPEVKAFLDFYINENPAIVELALFIPLTVTQIEEARTKVARLAGS